MRQMRLFEKSKRGRPRIKNGRVSHLRRERFKGRFPLLVTMKVLEGVPNLETRDCLRVIERGFLSLRREVRLVHFAVLGNHLHLICEAPAQEVLARGMQGLEIRLAKGVNRVMGRSGRVFADRYHVRVLRSPSQTKNAVSYVLRNHEKHYGPGWYGSSSLFYSGWTVAPQTWLLKQVPS